LLTVGANTPTGITPEEIEMSRSFKQDFAEAVSDLLSVTSVTPEPGRILVSQPLDDAIREIEAELARPRTNWHLIAALTAVKSYVCGARPDDEAENHFWEVRSGNEGRDVYGTLDSLHFRAAMRVGVMPSGISVYAGTTEGIGVRHGEVDTSASPASPTLRLIAQERARIEARHTPMTAEASGE